MVFFCVQVLRAIGLKCIALTVRSDLFTRILLTVQLVWQIDYGYVEKALVATEAKRHGNLDPLGSKRRKVDKRTQPRNLTAIQSYHGTTWQAVERLCSELRSSARDEKIAEDQMSASVQQYHSVNGAGWAKASSSDTPLQSGSARPGEATCKNIPQADATFTHLEFQNSGLLKRAAVLPTI